MPRTRKITDKIVYTPTIVTPEIEYVVEPTTLEEYAEEYKRIEREMSALTKRKGDMRKKIIELVPPDTTVELDNGLKIIRTTYASKHFEVKLFEKEHPKMYEDYLTDLLKEKLTVDYIKK